jgi:hypothetical protein
MLDLIHHILGICPDNAAHFDLMDALVFGMSEINYALLRLRFMFTF